MVKHSLNMGISTQQPPLPRTLPSPYSSLWHSSQLRVVSPSGDLVDRLAKRDRAASLHNSVCEHFLPHNLHLHSPNLYGWDGWRHQATPYTTTSHHTNKRFNILLKIIKFYALGWQEHIYKCGVTHHRLIILKLGWYQTCLNLVDGTECPLWPDSSARFRETPGVKSCRGGIICLPSEQLYEGVDKENQMGCVQS